MKGIIKGNTYFTRRKPNHFMRKYQGFGISYEIVVSLKKNGIEKVFVVYEGENGIISYKCDIEQFLNSNKKYTYQGRLSQDKEDLQVFVSVKDMEKEI